MSLTRLYYMHAVEIWVRKLISELECHSEKANENRKRFDQHSWKDDKTTFNSFEFWHWLIKWHKKLCVEMKIQSFLVNCALLQTLKIIGFDGARKCCRLPLELRSWFRKRCDCVRKWAQIIFKEKKKSYKRRTKSSSETSRRLKRCFHFTPGWLWREIR